MEKGKEPTSSHHRTNCCCCCCHFLFCVDTAIDSQLIISFQDWKDLGLQNTRQMCPCLAMIPVHSNAKRTVIPLRSLSGTTMGNSSSVVRHRLRLRQLQQQQQQQPVAAVVHHHHHHSGFFYQAETSSSSELFRLARRTMQASGGVSLVIRMAGHVHATPPSPSRVSCSFLPLSLS